MVLARNRFYDCIDQSHFILGVFAFLVVHCIHQFLLWSGMGIKMRIGAGERDANRDFAAPGKDEIESGVRLKVMPLQGRYKAVRIPLQG